MPPISPTSLRTPAFQQERVGHAQSEIMPRFRQERGFNLIQVMLSMAIGSIVIAAAVPKVKQAEAHSRATIIVNDLRTFVTQFEAYAQETGGWPAETEAGELPPEMAGRLGQTGWQRPTPIGGQYNWDNNQRHAGNVFRAAISISSTALSPLPVNEETLLDIDKLIDDGNLTTGNFRIGVNNDPVFIIQQ